MALEIRPATIEDHAAVSRIAAALNEPHARALPERFRHAADPMPLEHARSLVEGDDIDIVVAVRGNEIVGYEVLRLQETPPIEIMQPRRFVLVSALAVSERSRGQGIGRALIDAALAWARDNGASGVGRRAQCLRAQRICDLVL